MSNPTPHRTPLVVIESPFAGSNAYNVKKNVEYARAAMADSLKRGEAPIASHLLYTQPGILNDDIPEERHQGIEAGLSWAAVSDLTVFYVDRGWSKGMYAAFYRAKDAGRPYELRCLTVEGGRWMREPTEDDKR
jgi:hypothetical protein